MRELPILCAAPVVRAILDGRQTQDRRPVKPQPEPDPTLTTCWHESWKDSGRVKVSWEYWAGPVYHARPVTYACGLRSAVAPWSHGDVLYVRETWRPYIRGWSSHVQYAAGTPPRPTGHATIGKSLSPEASDEAMRWMAERGGVAEYECVDPDTIRWFPSIHMPKWAARIRLRVLSVSVERVGAISDADAKAEGCDDVAGFARLWDGLYGTRPGLDFAASPWVWVTTFERITDAP